MIKVRDLSIAKKYRESTKRWGEPDIIRKRIIIAPPMSDASAKNVNLVPLKEKPRGAEKASSFAADVERIFRLIKLDDENDMASNVSKEKFAKDFTEYKDWVQQQKQLRADLQNLGLNSNWLSNKNDKTFLEERVLQRMQPSRPDTESSKYSENEIETHLMRTPPPLSKAQMRLLPLLQQPIPVALSIIAEHCHKNKLRLLDLYKQIDKDKDWQISREEFRKVVRDNKIPLTDAQLEVMIIGLDADDNDKLDYRELAQGVEAYKIDDRWKKIRELMSIVEARNEEKQSTNHSRPPSNRRSRPSTKSSVKFKTDGSDSGSEFSDSSLDFLNLPKVDSALKSDATANKTQERRMKKRMERKEEQKRQSRKEAAGKGYLPSTMEGLTGQIKDRYAERQVKHTHESLDMMHTEGIPVKTEAVKKVLLFPFDKSVQDCKTSLRQPGTSLVGESTFRKSKHSLLSNDAEQKLKGKKNHQKEVRSDDYYHERKGRRSPRKQTRGANVFWTDAESPTLSIEDLGKRTPSGSLFRVVRTPSFL